MGFALKMFFDDGNDLAQIPTLAENGINFVKCAEKLHSADLFFRSWLSVNEKILLPWALTPLVTFGIAVGVINIFRRTTSCNQILMLMLARIFLIGLILGIPFYLEWKLFGNACFETERNVSHWNAENAQSYQDTFQKCLKGNDRTKLEEFTEEFGILESHRLQKIIETNREQRGIQYRIPYLMPAYIALLMMLMVKITESLT